MKKPPEYFFPHRPVSIKRPKSYDFIIQMIAGLMVILSAIGIITQKGCDNEKDMEHKDKAVDVES